MSGMLLNGILKCDHEGYFTYTTFMLPKLGLQQNGKILLDLQCPVIINIQ